MAWKDFSQQHRFASIFIPVVVLLSFFGIARDLCAPEETYWWFQRSGALMTLAGIEAQYVKLIDQAQGMTIPPVSWHDRIGIPLAIVGTLVWAFGDLAVLLLRGQA